MRLKGGAAEISEEGGGGDEEHGQLPYWLNCLTIDKRKWQKCVKEHENC